MAHYLDLVRRELVALDAASTFKHEVPLQGPQDGVVTVGGRNVVMLASNNYLGLSNHPQIRKAAIQGIREDGWYTMGKITVKK